MSQDGLAYSARDVASADDGSVATPTDWPTGEDFPPTGAWPTGWSGADASTYLDGNTKDGLHKIAGWTSPQATRSGILGSAYTALVAATPITTRGQHNSFGADFHITSYCQDGVGGNYHIGEMHAFRSFYTFTPPAGTAYCYFYYDGCDANFYSTSDGAGDDPENQTVPPTWYVQVYHSTTTPGTIAAGDWDWGTKGAQIQAVEEAYRSTTTSPVGKLTTYDSDDAGVAHYLQTRVDEAMPSFVAGATWYDHVIAGGRTSMWLRPFSPDDGGTAYGTLKIVYHDGT